MLRKIKSLAQLKFVSMVAKFRKSLCGPHAAAIIGNTPNGLFAMDIEDYGVGGQILKHGVYGQEELDLLVGYLKPEFKVLVVGSHIGTLAIPIAKRVKSVHAIEANPQTFQLLKMNIGLNQVGNISAEHVAASNKHEKISFLLNRVNSGGSKRVPLIGDAAYYFDNPEAIQVDAVPLDEHLDGAFDAIIMDIEGSEAFALAGMPRLLSAAKFLQVEFLPHHQNNVGGVSVAEFLDLIAPYFDRLFVPSLDRTFEKGEFIGVLQKMYDAGEGDNGIVFTKA